MSDPAHTTIDDTAIADMVLGAYEYDGKPYPWTQLWQGEMSGGVYVGRVRLWGVDVVVFRGSVTEEDWVRDFFALAHTLDDHPQLGPVHAGFALGIDRVFAEIMPTLGPRVVVAGHSLGGARALLFAGLMVAAGKMPDRVVVFGAPRPGCAPLVKLLEPVMISAYRNGSGSSWDLVTDVPASIPLLAPYRTPRRPLIDVTGTPAPADAFGLFAWHHMTLYRQGLGGPKLAQE